MLIGKLACALLLSLFPVVELRAQNPGATQVSNQQTAEQKASLSEASRLSQNVVNLHRARKYNEAIPTAQRVWDLRRSVLGDNNPLVAEAISNLATLHLEQQEFERAESLFKKALASYDAAGSVTPNIMYVLDTLTLLRWRQGDFDKAESYGKRAITVKEHFYKVEDSRLLVSIQNLIKVYDSAGKVSQRNALVLRSVSLLEKTKTEALTDGLSQSLVMYYCAARDGKQTPESVQIEKRIEQLLGWNPTMLTPPVQGGVLNGRALSLPKPAYPIEARLARASGVVVVEVEINECGNVDDVKVVSGPSELKSSAEQAAKRSRFSPTLVGGRPIKVIGVIQYNFVHGSGP